MVNLSTGRLHLGNSPIQENGRSTGFMCCASNRQRERENARRRDDGKDDARDNEAMNENGSLFFPSSSLTDRQADRQMEASIEIEYHSCSVVQSIFMTRKNGFCPETIRSDEPFGGREKKKGTDLALVADSISLFSWEVVNHVIWHGPWIFSFLSNLFNHPSDLVQGSLMGSLMHSYNVVASGMKYLISV